MAQDESRDERDQGEEPDEEPGDDPAEDETREQGSADEAPAERDDPDDADEADDADDRGDANESDEADDSGGENGSTSRDASDITAPSIGPDTKIEREPPEERLARHEQSTEDAMGLDKHREVTGRSYGPSRARQATLYGIALAVIVLLVAGGIFATNQLDQPPDDQQDEAPWSQPDADQRPVEPLQ